MSEGKLLAEGGRVGEELSSRGGETVDARGDEGADRRGDDRLGALAEVVGALDADQIPALLEGAHQLLDEERIALAPIHGHAQEALARRVWVEPGGHEGVDVLRGERSQGNLADAAQ